jgi:hypothetical protein
MKSQLDRNIQKKEKKEKEGRKEKRYNVFHHHHHHDIRIEKNLKRKIESCIGIGTWPF